MKPFLNHPVAAALFPALLGLAGAAFMIRVNHEYGWVLFAALPFLISTVSAFLYSYGRKTYYGYAYLVSIGAILLTGFFIFLLAMDGLICLLMALPLALLLALPGAWAGRALGQEWGGSGRPPGPSTPLILLLCALLPFLAGWEHRLTPEPRLREVTSRVVIHAPIERVWETVIAFPKITAPPTGVFALGVAYPIEASIQGAHGPGALRYCTFSTGSFVEPITHWEAPTLLAFSVTENPPPMHEVSIYPDLHPPHFDGFMKSERGQFRLSRQPDGTTLVEGTTWYTHDLAPQAYWGPISDHIIHEIHGRVLNHIKATAEAGK